MNLVNHVLPPWFTTVVKTLSPMKIKNSKMLSQAGFQSIATSNIGTVDVGDVSPSSSKCHQHRRFVAHLKNKKTENFKLKAEILESKKWKSLEIWMAFPIFSPRSCVLLSNLWNINLSSSLILYLYIDVYRWAWHWRKNKISDDRM